MPTTATVVSVLAGVIAVLSVYVYFFGIPPAVKREMEEKALKAMGENRASYLVKDQINKIPATDQPGVKDIKKGLGNLAGGTVNNPLGKFTGDTADDVARPFTGR